ncbi:endoplasmic reticulum oxidoreductin-1-like [Zingiber officinale]|uniref:endoplasmic reticulum oxidoreductin-1-like n=1 Tax=Zingiber officinale TaxID=94328 RepID=UPI001C4CE840|nr:endoplasmic reticulum oxidoreductin-1-like [Zingiber officinale]
MGKDNVSHNDAKARRRLAWAGAVVLIATAIAIASSSSFSSSTNKLSDWPLGPGNYTGLVEGCCCDYETTDSVNELVLHPLLQELVKTPFFRYFKVKLWCDCPFWPDDGMCHLRDCSVCECPESEFPEPFKKLSRGHSVDEAICQEGKQYAAVDKTLDDKVFKGWIEIDNPWTYDDETDNSAMTFVNLQLNPERYTGYTGTSTQRIWTSVYKDNCPKYPDEELCDEKTVMYKLISGLHSSISVHIASDYLLDVSTNLWGPNVELFYDRVWKHPDRVKNLYFIFLFVMRAVTKAADYLEQAEYNTGNPIEDLKTQSLVRQLVYNPKIHSSCPLPFNEAKLWQGTNGPELKEQVLKQFRNISAIMNCVACEKCRLWGKLQVNGLATALKVLFSVNGNNPNQHLQLQRNEVIALFNLLNRLSESLKFVHDMRASMEKMERQGTSSAGKTTWLQDHNVT